MKPRHILPLCVSGLLLCLLPLAAEARHHHGSSSSLETVAVAELPPEAQETLKLIKKDGPFPYTRDGIVFGNREHQLPPQPRGYYHEYTVKTPGAHDRGPRRIVCGPLPECYYSADHYRTFRSIAGEH
jgi:ribonuclease T1